MQRPGENRSTECSICLEIFRDPRRLPCNHTFCAPCLQRLIDNCDLSFNRLILGIRCPLCRTFVQVPAEGAHGFPRDGQIAAELAKRTVVQVPAAGAQGFPRNDQMAAELANRTVVQSWNFSSTDYYFGYLILVAAILVYAHYRNSSQMAKERKTWEFEKQGYEVSEELLRKQIQDLIAKEKSLPAEREFNKQIDVILLRLYSVCIRRHLLKTFIFG